MDTDSIASSFTIGAVEIAAIDWIITGDGLKESTEH
jgi:hypothetical protein